MPFSIYFDRRVSLPDASLPGALAHPRMTDANLSAFIWSVADLLRGDYKQSDYGKVILPFTVLRRDASEGQAKRRAP